MAGAELERLQKFMARAGVGSRRHNEKLIAEGHVAINGAVVRQLGVKVNPGVDVVTVDGKRVTIPPELIYLMLNKPAGYITAVEEQRGRPTVMDLVRDPDDVYPSRFGDRQRAERLKDYRLFPVGRLDLDTGGLLIVTNDGELANRLTHPRYALEKEYVARVHGTPNEKALDALRQGIEIDGERTAPAKVRLLGSEDGSARLSITIHEGRKRQVRRMLDAVGHPVIKLTRIRVGPLHLGNLPSGRFRFLSGEEVAALHRAVGLAPEDRSSRATGPAGKVSKRERPPDHIRSTTKGSDRSSSSRLSNENRRRRPKRSR